jgi:SprT protein
VDVNRLRQALTEYVPDGALQICVDWIVEHRISVRVTKSRSSKYGDYTPPHKGKSHRISVNHDLNKFSFLLTFTHEVAHLITWKKYRNSINAHGKEWKYEFKVLLYPLIHQGVFPADVSVYLKNYIIKPSASSCTDINLTRVLSRYDEIDDAWSRLEDISFNSKFITRSGRMFIKGNKLRKNYCCIDVSNNHTYYVNPTTEVQCVDEVQLSNKAPESL